MREQCYEPPVTRLNSWVAGINHRPEAVRAVRMFDVPFDVQLQREPENPHDRNAVQVWVGRLMLGYVPQRDSALVAEAMDSRRPCCAFVNKLVFDETIRANMIIGYCREGTGPDHLAALKSDWWTYYERKR